MSTITLYLYKNVNLFHKCDDEPIRKWWWEKRERERRERLLIIENFLVGNLHIVYAKVYIFGRICNCTGVCVVCVVCCVCVQKLNFWSKMNQTRG
jgi:hypothetical protein